MRDWYLANLGVIQYLPRERGAGLQPMEGTYDQPQVALETAELSGDNAEQPAAQQPVQSFSEGIHQAIIDTIASELEATVSAVTPVPDTPEVVESNTEEIAEAINFRMACWQPSEDLLIINQLDESQGLTPQHAQLVQNIATALWLKRQQMAEDTEVGQIQLNSALPELITWPDSPNDQKVDSSRSAAVAMLAAFVEARVTMRGVCRVILMGQLPDQLVGPEVDQAGVKQLSGGARACVTPSLSELLNQPAQKAQAWQAMLGLL